MATSQIPTRLNKMAEEIVGLVQEELIAALKAQLTGTTKEEPRRRPKHKKEPRKRGRKPRAKLSPREQDVLTALQAVKTPLSSEALAKKLGVGVPAVSRHLASLVQKKIVKRVREGRSIFYQPR